MTIETTSIAPVDDDYIELTGCAPAPLAHYLAALAVLRLVAEQHDPSVRGWWDSDTFLLDTSLDQDELVDFFLNEYSPTPIIAPWNGGGGIRRKKLKDEVQVVADSQGNRFADLRTAIHQAIELLELFGVDKFTSKVDSDIKEEYLVACRSRFPDSALPWLDAAFVLTADGPKYPPIYGTGGNDGRLDFTLNFLRRLDLVFDFETGKPTPNSESWLRAALFDLAESHLPDDAVGQFFPQAAGGVNQATGFEGKAVSNPWEYILMIEGAVMFAAAAAKKLESSDPAALSAPFCVRHVGVGQASTDTSDEESARPEMWVPLWNSPASVRELRSLMSEGRARVGRRAARDGVDFARAVASLGVDRGVSEFYRYGFQERNGLAYFATPLNRIRVNSRPEIKLIDDIDWWLDRFLGRAKSDDAPGSIKSAARRLQASIFALCETGGVSASLDVLIDLGRSQRALGKSLSWTLSNNVPPLRNLSPTWLERTDDGTAEFRLAASLASVYGEYGKRGFVSIREQLEPVDIRRRTDWKQQRGRDAVWHDGDPIDAMHAVMHRRLLVTQQCDVATWPDKGQVRAPLELVHAFVDGRVDLRRMTDILWGLVAIAWPRFDRDIHWTRREHSRPSFPGALFSALKLCFAGPDYRIGMSDEVIPPVTAIHHHASRGNGLQASRLAVRRLRGSGLTIPFDRIYVNGAVVRRAAAALLFPLSRSDLTHLEARTIVREEDGL